VTPSEEQIVDTVERAALAGMAGTTEWPGMTYEQGVEAALRWVTGETQSNPMDD
jgi:hypothetical protein